MRTAVLILFILTASDIAAQTPAYDRVLLPVRPGDVDGAFGSQWNTLAVVSNHGNTAVDIRGAQDPCGSGLCGPPPPLPAKSTWVVADTPACGQAGVFLYVEAGRLSDLTFNLRSRDMSRENQTWGTSVPVVTPNALFSNTFSITDIPIEHQFRSTLRLFDVETATLAPLRVRVYRPDLLTRRAAARPDVLLKEYLVTPAPPSASLATLCPAYAEISLSGDSTFTNETVLRIEVEPTEHDREYWGYVAVTHNDTQHATILTPTQ